MFNNSKTLKDLAEIRSELKGKTRKEVVEKIKANWKAASFPLKVSIAMVFLLLNVWAFTNDERCFYALFVAVCLAAFMENLQEKQPPKGE